MIEFFKPVLSFLILFWGVTASGKVSADASDFGTTGLIKMPSARMALDGTLRATLAHEEVASLYNITFQAHPKVQATFRYVIFNPDDVPGSLDGLRDRSYEVKLELLKERSLLPQVSIGARDVLGTGALEGEYLVGSKVWRDFDFTIGMGWGRLGSRDPFKNPLGLLSQRFDARPTSSGGEYGGESRGNSFFRGEASLFGGVSYKFRDKPFVLIAEYESDKYTREVGLRTLDPPRGFNFGLVWQPIRDTTLRLSLLRGNTLGFTLSSQLQTKQLAKRKAARRQSSEILDEATGLPPGYSADSWYDRMVFESERSGLYLKKGVRRQGDTKATMVVENISYNLTADALSQIFTLSEMYMPAKVDRVEVLLEEDGFVGPTINYSLQRGSKRFEASRSFDAKAFDRVQILEPRKIAQPTNDTDYGYPTLGFGIDLATRFQLMDPDDPARKQIYAKLTGRLRISEHVNVWGRYEQNLFNDFSTKRRSNSVLPKVRTLVNEYLVNGTSGLEQLYIEHKRSLSSSIHTWIYGGILETMYGGVGGEVLYSPYKSRWALSFHVNAVRQREFERNFRFRDYKTVTGFVSVYYAMPFNDIDLAVHVGRYLAQDRGYTFEARRTFDSGFSIGGFFTRTNVSAEDFGEGSFDKGFFFRIPFDGLLPGNTKTATKILFRPLERDGGRRLESFGGSLWFDRRPTRYDALDRNINRMLPR